MSILLASKVGLKNNTYVNNVGRCLFSIQDGISRPVPLTSSPKVGGPSGCHRGICGRFRTYQLSYRYIATSKYGTIYHRISAPTLSSSHHWQPIASTKQSSHITRFECSVPLLYAACRLTWSSVSSKKKNVGFTRSMKACRRGSVFSGG